MVDMTDTGMRYVRFLVPADDDVPYLYVEDEEVLSWAGNDGGQAVKEVIVKRSKEALLVHVAEPQSDGIEEHGIRNE